MRGLSFNRDGPKTFILAVDGAFAALDPQNDQVWELNLHGTHAYPFCLQTTYGLRARSMRLFPRIRVDNEDYHDSHRFYCRPEVTCYAPDTLRIDFRPFESLSLQCDVFVPETDILVGSFKIRNLGSNAFKLTFALAAVLLPMGKGIPTRPEREGVNQIIVGQTKELWPVLFMTGGPSAVNSPYPALSIPIFIKPGGSRRLTWALAAKQNRSVSLDAARTFIASHWAKASQAHVMKHAAQTIRIHTDRPDWDAAFALAQVAAMTHFVSRCKRIDQPFFLRTRLPDRPPYNSWEQETLDDLTALEATHLAQVLLPAQAELLKGFVEDLLSRSDEEGFLPSRLNASLFVRPFRECPLLASLCLNLYEQDGDKDFLKRVFPALCRILDSWLSTGNDQDDGGGFYAWEDTQQLQLDTGLFNFDSWEETGKGLALQSAESPALLTMLYNEGRALSKAAEILGEDAAQKKYLELAQILGDRLNRTWQSKWRRFAYLDGESHKNLRRELHVRGRVQETLDIHQVFKAPQRLQVHLHSADEHTRVCIVTIKGKDVQGEAVTEQFKPRDIHWSLRNTHLTTRQLFKAVDSIQIAGAKPEDQFLIETADYSEGDITCLLPVWSRAVTHKRNQSMVKAHLNPENAGLDFGIPETWRTTHKLPEELPIRVNVLWNTMIIEGLLRQGFIEEAAALYSRLMSTIVSGLCDFSGFYPYYDSKTGKPAGKRNAIAGLAPLQLFLKIAGIHLFSPVKVALMAHNPFAGKIEVRWQGLHIQREGTHTIVSFPNGSVYECDPDGPILVAMGEV